MKYEVVYFTRTGNSKRVAEKISSKLGTDLIEIKDHMRWNGFIGYMRAGFYSTMDKKVQITLSEPLKDYDELIVVSPLWAGGLASATRSFLTTLPREKVHLVVTSIGSVIKDRTGYKSVTDIIERSQSEDAVIEKFASHLMHDLIE
jgi:hypothetical protein